MKGKALLVHEQDNVATLLVDVLPGDGVNIIDATGKTTGSILSKEAVSRGHKLAIMDLGINCSVIKYGEIIGRTIVSIKKGAWVHVHNIESLRGRGDLNHG